MHTRLPAGLIPSVVTILVGASCHDLKGLSEAIIYSQISHDLQSKVVVLHSWLLCRSVAPMVYFGSELDTDE